MDMIPDKKIALQTRDVDQAMRGQIDAQQAAVSSCAGKFETMLLEDKTDDGEFVTGYSDKTMQKIRSLRTTLTGGLLSCHTWDWRLIR